jgi:hypothetical protein
MSSAVCKVAIKQSAKAGEITDAQADAIFERAQKLLEEKARVKNINIDEAIKTIEGELSLHTASEATRLQRQMLLNLDARRSVTMDIIRFSNDNEIGYDKALEFFFLGGESKGASGFGGGMHRKMLSAASADLAQVNNDLIRRKVWDAAVAKHSPENVLAELSAYAGSGKPIGHTGDNVAREIAEALYYARDTVNSKVKVHGGYVENRKGYSMPVTHVWSKILALGDGDRALAKEKWISFIMPMLDVPRLVSETGMSAKDVLSNIFDNLETSRHEWNFEENMFPDQPRAFGSLAERFAKERTLPFLDSTRELEYAKMFGRYGDDYMMAILGQIEMRSKTATALANLGPSGFNNIREVVKLLLKHAEALPDSDPMRVKHIKGLDIQTRGETLHYQWKAVSGLTDIPENEVIARLEYGVRTYINATKGAAMLLTSFGDAVVSPNQAIYAGASALDAYGNRLRFLFTSQKEAAQILSALGLASDAFSAESMSIIGAQMGSTEWLRNMNKKVFNYTLMNWFSQSGRLSTAWTIAADWGEQAVKTFDSLSTSHKRMLVKYKISPLMWDVIRTTAGEFDIEPMKGHKFLSHEKFSQISDSQVDRLIVESGKTPTPANRLRMRSKLTEAWSEFLHDRVAAAMSEMGGQEKYITTGFGKFQAGSLKGAAVRALGMYKTFPLAFFRRQAGMLQNLGAVKGTAAGVAQIAALTIAGYTSMAVKNIIVGKEPPKIIDEQGNFKWQTFYAAMERGGGGGLWASILLGEYHYWGRSVFDNIAGPVYGTMADMVIGLRALFPDDDESESSSDTWKAIALRKVENLIPGMNLFYIKPAYEHAIGFYLKEMLSPGYLAKQEQAAMQRGDRYFVRPSQIAEESFDERMVELITKPKKAVEAMTD